MRIAVCFSGQPRTWKKCYESWNNLFSQFDVEVDYFCHIWNFNTLPQILNISTPQLIDSNEIDDMLSILKPKKFIIEDYSKNLKVKEDLKNLGKKYPFSGGTPIYWSGAQFYSHMYSVHLKRQHEIENNIEYNICFRMRTDLFIDQTAIDDFIRNFQNPKPNTIYSCHNGRTTSFPFSRIGDIFYYSDSITFDKLAEFYRFLPIIGKSPFQNDSNPPEMIFPFFIKMIRIKNFITTADLKVMRTTEYLTLKGDLGGHELI